MEGTSRLKIGEINKNLICTLCGGYFVDATTIIECLHSFCRTCIVTYLKTSKTCPTCDTVVHKTRPHQNIRSDLLLQDLVYKLVPGLYKDEMRRRREFYTSHYHAAPKRPGEERGDEMGDRFAYTEEENISLALYLLPDGGAESLSFRRVFSTKEELQSRMERRMKEAVDTRYLQCKAGVTVGLLKRFARLKYGLPAHFEIEMFHSDEPLKDSNTLCDIAYTYNWRRRSPLALAFCVCETPATKPRPPRLLAQLNPVRDKIQDTKVLKENRDKKQEVVPTKDSSVKEEDVTPEKLPDSADITKKLEDTEDLIKKEKESPLKQETQPKDIISNNSHAVLRDSTSNNTDQPTPKKCRKEKGEANTKTVKQKLWARAAKSKNKSDDDKCNRPPEKAASTQCKNIKVEICDEKKSQSVPDPASINSTNCTPVKIENIGVATTSSSQSHTSNTPALTTASTTPITVTPANKVSQSAKLSGSHSNPTTTTTQSSLISKTPTDTVVSQNPNSAKSSNSQPENSTRTKVSKTNKPVLGKRPANSPVLIAPAPAKIQAVCPSMVDISHVIKMENNQQGLTNLRNTCGIVNNCNNNHITPTINLVPMLPVGLPTSSPSPKNMALPKNSKSSKGMKKFSSFTVANLLGSHTPKRTRVRAGPSVARIKPPVLNFINTGASNSAVSSSQTSGHASANAMKSHIQTPLVPSVSGFLSPLMLPHAQLYLSPNGVTHSGLRLTPTSIRNPAQTLAVNPAALGTHSVNSTQSFATSKTSAPGPPLTISFPSMGVPTTLPSLANLPAPQSAFFSSTLASVPASQLFSSIQTTMQSPFCFPSISLSSSSSSPSSSLVSSSTSSSTPSSTSSTALSSASKTKTSTTSSSSVTSTSFITTTNSLSAVKAGRPIPPSSMSSPPPAAPASPTPAAVPVQQSQTQGADSGFPGSAPVVANLDNSHKTNKIPAVVPKNKAKVSSNTAQLPKAGSKSKVSSSHDTNSVTKTSTQSNSNAFKPGPAFAHCLPLDQGKVNNSSKSSLAGKRNAATAFSPEVKGDMTKTPGPKKVKIKETGLSCVPTSSLTSPGTPSSSGISKSSISPATALSQLCITSPNSQAAISTTAGSNPTTFVFPATPIQTSDKADVKTNGEKNPSNGVVDNSKTPQTLSSKQNESNKVNDGTSQTPKSSPTTSGPISPSGRSLAIKPKKKIADIANTLHKRVNESMQAHSSCSISQDRAPKSSEPSHLNISTNHSTSLNNVGASNKVDMQRNRSFGDGSGGGMLLPVTKPVWPSPTSNSSETKQKESVPGARTIPTITSARHELPGRPLGLQNSPQAKGLSACLASRVEAKRIVSTGALMRSSTPTSVSTSNNIQNRQLQVDEQPLNLVKRDSSFPHVATSLLLADMKHAVK